MQRATVRGGSVVVVVDLSAGGALVEAPKPLPPGSRVHLHVTTEHGKVSLAAHVLRCAVWALDPEAGVTYRGALKFDHRCEIAWETGEGQPSPGPAVREHPRATEQHQPHHHHRATEHHPRHSQHQSPHRDRDRGVPGRGAKCHRNT